MATLHCSGGSMIRDVVKLVAQSGRLPPSFLLPAFMLPQRSQFSTSAPTEARKDGNPRRGMSAIRRTGVPEKIKRRLEAKLENLPQPVLDPAKRTKVEVDPNHGLWGFFGEQKKATMTPDELTQHGRGWTIWELRKKDFDDLWKLYWACIKEVNRINTFERERTRLNIGYGEFEANARRTEVKKTQRAIRQVLTERWYSFEEARELAMNDPEINLYANIAEGEQAYTPSQYAYEEESEEMAENAETYDQAYPVASPSRPTATTS